MAKYEISFRDREPLTVDADHMTIDRGSDGKPLGFEFLRKNTGDPATSIKPETVLYAVASEVVAVNTIPASASSTSSPHGGYARSETSFPVSPVLEDFAREFGKWLGDRGDRRR